MYFSHCEEEFDLSEFQKFVGLKHTHTKKRWSNGAVFMNMLNEDIWVNLPLKFEIKAAVVTNIYLS